MLISDYVKAFAKFSTSWVLLVYARFTGFFKDFLESAFFLLAASNACIFTYRALAATGFLAVDGLSFFKLIALAVGFGDTILVFATAIFLAARAYTLMFFLVGLTILDLITYATA